MQWHDAGSLKLATVTVLTLQKSANIVIKVFPRQSQLLNTVTVVTNDTGVNATPIIYAALTDIIG